LRVEEVQSAGTGKRQSLKGGQAKEVLCTRNLTKIPRKRGLRTIGLLKKTLLPGRGRRGKKKRRSMWEGNLSAQKN